MSEAGRAAPTGTDTPARVPELDGLRGLAIAGVLITHLYLWAFVPAQNAVHAALHRLFSLSHTGVDLFFVLSGYLIGGILLQARSSPNFYRAFYARRFFRILPVYALLLLSWLLLRSDRLDQLNGGILFAPRDVPLWSYPLFAQNLAMALVGSMGCTWLVVTWSLAIEEQFYLVMPWTVRQLDESRLLALAAGLVLLAPAVRLTLLELSPRAGIAAVFLPVSRMDALLLGVIAALLLRDAAARAWLQAHRALLSASALGLGLVFLSLSLGDYGMISWVATPFGLSAVAFFYFVLLLLALHPAESGWRRMLRWRWLGWLGTVSYFVYLFHLPLSYLLHGTLRHQPPRLVQPADYGVTLLVLAATLGLAALSWHMLEKPLLRLGHRIGSWN